VDRTFPVDPRWNEELEKEWRTIEYPQLFHVFEDHTDGHSGNGNFRLMAHGPMVNHHHHWIELYLCP
jgi:hypothetical protein